MMLNMMLLQWVVTPVIIQLALVLFGPLKTHSNLTSRLTQLWVKKLEWSSLFPWAFHDVMLCRKFIMLVLLP